MCDCRGTPAVRARLCFSVSSVRNAHALTIFAQNCKSQYMYQLSRYSVEEMSQIVEGNPFSGYYIYVTNRLKTGNVGFENNLVS